MAAKKQTEAAAAADEYSLSDFDIPNKLSWCPPRSKLDLWVFLSEDCDLTSHSSFLSFSPSIPGAVTNFGVFRKKLEIALGAAGHFERPFGCNMLVQYWAPMVSIRGGRSVLTTSNQPFGLSRIEKGLCEYRKHCMSLEFNLNNVDDDDGGVIGRVFRNQQVESTPDVGYYSTKEYPQRHVAINCGIRGSLALPVLLPPPDQCRVGVLELVATGENIKVSHTLHDRARRMLKVGKLETSLPLNFQEDTGDIVLDRINVLLGMVCTTHQLPLAQTWIPCRHSNAAVNRGSLEKSCYSCYLSCTKKFSSMYLHDSSGAEDMYEMMIDFSSVSHFHHFRKGQGVVGKALLSRKPCFCRDVTQLPIDEFPLSHYARKYGLTGCFAICLQSTTGTGNLDYVLEFFLPPWNTISGVPQTFLGSLLATVKKHFQGLEIAPRKELGEELSVEVVKFSVYDVPIPEFLQIGKEKMSVISERDGKDEVGKTEFSVEVSKSAVDDETTTRLAPMPESVQNEIEMVQLSDKDSTVKNLKNNESKVLVAEQNVGDVAYFEKEWGGVKTLSRKHRAAGLSLEHLIQHFGKKQDDVAHILGVSRSTLKRLCRMYGIRSWPTAKRTKVKFPAVSSTKDVNKRVQGGGEDRRIVESNRGDDDSFSDQSLKKAATGAAHTTPDGKTMQDFVTVKVRYRDVIIKFQLSLSSTLADLFEDVTKRLHLKKGTFSIKYMDEDGDRILVACDKDLHCFLDSWRSSPDKKNTIIKMIVDEPLPHQSP